MTEIFECFELDGLGLRLTQEVLFLLVGVHLFVLVRNSPFLEGNPSPLDERTELSMDRETSPHRYRFIAYPACIKDKILRLLMPLNGLGGIAGRNRVNLLVWDPGHRTRR